MALKAGRVGVNPNAVDDLGNIKNSGETYTLPVASPSTLGGVKPVNKTNDMTKDVGVDDGGKLYTQIDEYTLPIASSSTLGGVKPVSKTNDMTKDIGVDDEGKLYTQPDEYTLPIASPSTLGGVKPVSKTNAMTQNVGVDSDGKLFIEPPASGTKVFYKDFSLDTSISGGYLTSAVVDVSGYTPISCVFTDLSTGYHGVGSLYKNRGGGGDTEVLFTGNTPRVTARVFYISNDNIQELQ